MHDIVIESECGDPSSRDDHPYDHHVFLAIVVPTEFVDLLSMHQEMCHEVVHHQLQKNPVEHLWALKGGVA
jgi:hypothetical protein